MAALNNYLKRRDFLHSEKSAPGALSAAAWDFFKAERYSEALDFFEKAKDSEGIKKIKGVAMTQGDTFLLARLDRFDRTLVSREDWDAAAKTAEASGKTSMTSFVARRFAPPAVLPGTAPVEPVQTDKPGEAPLAEQ